MNQFSEKLGREQNNIKFFDEASRLPRSLNCMLTIIQETPEAAGILKLVDDDDDELLKGETEHPAPHHSPPRGFLDTDATRRRMVEPTAEHRPNKTSASAVNVAPSRDTFPVPKGPSQPVPPPRVPTSITEFIAQTHSSRTAQTSHVPRSITDVMARPKSPPRTSVPASITEQLVKPVQHIPLPPQAFNMTIAELVALARQALPPSNTTSLTAPSPLSASPPVPASVTQLLPNQPPIPTSITDLIARSPGSPSSSSASSGMSHETGSPWLSFNSSPGPRSHSAASSASTSPPPPHSFASYPTVTTNTLQNRLSSPTMYNSRPAAPAFQKGPSAPQSYNWGPVSPPLNPARGLPNVNPSPVPPYGLQGDAVPRATNGTGRNHSGAYAQWPGSQYAVHRN